MDILSDRVFKAYQCSALGNRSSRSEEESSGNGDDDEILEVEEEISEMELLRMMDLEEDALLVCRRLLRFAPESIKEVAKKLSFLNEDDLKSLYEHGWCIKDSTITDDVCERIRKETMREFKNGQMFLASDMHRETSYDQDPNRDRQARGDYIKWVHEDKNEVCAEIVAYIDQLLKNDLHSIVNMKGEREYQLSVYPQALKSAVCQNVEISDIFTSGLNQQIAARYERHRDAFPIDDANDQEQRRLTSIFYLNDSQWSDEDGGHLRIYHRPMNSESEKYHSVMPLGGRMVIFLSGAIDHAVEPSNRDRCAFTIWWR